MGEGDRLEHHIKLARDRSEAEPGGYYYSDMFQAALEELKARAERIAELEKVAVSRFERIEALQGELADMQAGFRNIARKCEEYSRREAQHHDRGPSNGRGSG